MIDPDIIKNLDLQNITNPKLKRIFEERNLKFQFFYKEGTYHSEGKHTEYCDHKDYTEYREKHSEYHCYAADASSIGIIEGRKK